MIGVHWKNVPPSFSKDRAPSFHGFWIVLNAPCICASWLTFGPICFLICKSNNFNNKLWLLEMHTILRFKDIGWGHSSLLSEIFGTAPSVWLSLPCGLATQILETERYFQCRAQRTLLYSYEKVSCGYLLSLRWPAFHLTPWEVQELLLLAPPGPWLCSGRARGRGKQAGEIGPCSRLVIPNPDKS